MATREKKLSLDSLRVGMVLAKDVINPETGELIAAKDKALDMETLVELKTFYIDYNNETEVDEDTFADQSQEDVNILAGSIPYLPEKERQNYVNFKNTYAESYEKTKELLGNLQAGNMPELSRLNQVTEEILSTVRLKSDVFAYINYLKGRGDFLYDHSVCVSLVSKVFADWLGFSEQESEMLSSTGLLHDIGMTKVAENIVNKQTKLSDEEFIKITMHPIYGYNMLKSFELPEDIKYGVLQHHERIDGSGYPNHLNGNQINRFAKIIAIVDVFAAMVNNRPYREKFAPFRVIKTFEREYFDKLDTKYLMTFLQNIAYNYIDRKVRLSDNRIATIVFINKSQCSAPIVKLEDGGYIDLLFDKSVSIVEVL